MPSTTTRPSRRLSTRRAGALATALAVLLPLAACSSEETGDEGEAPDDTTTGEVTESTQPPGEDVLTIMVTNDDGVAAEGIDLLVQELSALPDTEVVVVAPAANQSGSGGSTTDGELVVSEATTASGVEATSIEGFPADTVVWAFDQGGLDELPDLVVSGVNFGQNIGPFVELSGTVGAARAAGERGVPALAVSSGLGDPVDYATAVDLAVEWVGEHREELLGGLSGDEPAEVWSINVPTCPTGEVRGLVEVPTAADAGGRDVNAVDCESTATDPVDDIAAFTTGYATLDEVSPAA